MDEAMGLAAIQSKIIELRGVKVMLDRDLAALYRVETKQLNRAVKRNVERFPSSYMFQLNECEYKDLKCQFGTSSWGGVRKLPYVFTEHGVLMTASVLKSKLAIQVNQIIIEAFVKLISWFKN